MRNQSTCFHSFTAKDKGFYDLMKFPVCYYSKISDKKRKYEKEFIQIHLTHL
jgi:hypothetical protein